MKSMALIGAASLALAACASSGAVPADKLAQSQAAVRSAEELGAERNPPAALHLKVAREQLDMARKLIAEGDNRRAEYVLMRAQSDAEVALDLTREARARMDAMKTIEEVQKLRTSTRMEGT